MRHQLRITYGLIIFVGSGLIFLLRYEYQRGEFVKGSGLIESDPIFYLPSLHAAVAELEKRLIREALQTCQQNQLQAAKTLGLSRQGLINKMTRYGIRVS